MARISTAAPPAPKVEQPTMNAEMNQPSPQVQDGGEDASATAGSWDSIPPSQAAKGVESVVAEDKSVEENEDEVAMPIPIATLVFQDGRTQPVYQPLEGLEHLFKAQPMSRSPAASGKRISVHQPIQAAPARAPGTPQLLTLDAPQQDRLQKQPTRRLRKSATQKPGLLKSKSLKRSRSVAQGLVSDRDTNVDKDGDDTVEPTIQVMTEESHSFYIGDIQAFKDFLHHRFDELTMKPLRGIATHWVKLLEPRRLGDWGKYHEMLPSEADTPPWWPETVIYKEPSHLKKGELSTLAVEMMLIHRCIDEVKRKGPWIAKLRDVAKFTVQTTSADHFSSSKGVAHSEEMKSRALDEILPSIFEVAQSYEDHIMQYSLFEDSGNVDPGQGMHHTWKPIPRPARRTQQPKRPRRSTKQDGNPEASGDETEPDDTMTRLARIPHNLPMPAPSPQFFPGLSHSVAHTPRHSFTADESYPQTWKVDTPASTSGPCTPVLFPENVRMHRTASTPNSSFDQSLHGLHIGEEELELKSQTRTLSEQGHMQPYSMVPYNPSMPYPAAPTAFNDQMYQPAASFPSTTSSSYGQAGPTFINPFSMYPAPFPMGYGQYGPPMATPNGLPYDANVFPPTPVGFASTPMPPSDANMAFQGHPTEYTVDPQGLHRF